MDGLGMNRMRLGLENITELLRRLGDPQNDFRSVHIAGSDGKGSTCAMIYSILLDAGISTGLYTSPHLISFNERISVNGADISDDELTTLADIVRPVADEMASEGEGCTFFEVATALAFLHFSRTKVRYAVLETGMGGRLDATNTVVPEVTGITNISLEHTEILGDTKEKIAFEKAGIIKTGVPVITPNEGSVLNVMTKVAAEKGAPMTAVRRGDVNVTSFRNGYASVSYLGNEYEIGIPGRYQSENAAVAIECIRRLECVSDDNIRNGLKNVRWNGRMDYFPDDDVIVDVSHTPGGAEKLAIDILETYGKVNLILGMFGDKDADGICRPLSEISLRTIVTAPASERAMPAEGLADVMRKYSDDVCVTANVRDAIDIMIGNGTLLITGSLFMAGEAIAYLRR